MNKIEPMKRDDVIKAVERRGPSRISLVRAKWWGEGLAEQYGERLQEFDRYPEDVVFLFGDNPVAPRKMNLPWKWNTGAAHDSNCVIDDWAKLDDFIARLPEPASDPRFENGIVSGTPFENIEAFLDEAVVYGEKHRLARNIQCSRSQRKDK